SDFGDLEVSAVTLKFVPPRASVVVYTLPLFVMFLLMPPAVRKVAPSVVGVNVCTRDNSASHCLHEAGFLSVGTIRTSMALCAIACPHVIAVVVAASRKIPKVLPVVRILSSCCGLVVGAYAGKWGRNPRVWPARGRQLCSYRAPVFNACILQTASKGTSAG